MLDSIKNRERLPTFSLLNIKLQNVLISEILRMKFIFKHKYVPEHFDIILIL